MKATYRRRLLIEEARERGRNYLTRGWGCAPTTLLAVADTLNITVNDYVFKSMLGLSSLSGGCGGIVGAEAALGLRYGFARPDQDLDLLTNPHWLTIRQLLKQIRDKFTETYGGYLCRDILMTQFGRTFDFTSPADCAAFRKEKSREKCSQVTENAAGWTIEAILNMESTE